VGGETQKGQIFAVKQKKLGYFVIRRVIFILIFNFSDSVSVFSLVISVLLHARTRMGDPKENGIK
jgi:hypothetical protein